MDPSGAGRTFTVAARPTSAGIVRATTRAWLASRAWPHPWCDDIVTAVDEAISNAIEHAYAASDSTGTIAIELHMEYDVHGSRQVRARVHDHGRWRPPTTDPGVHHRGLDLVRALMDEVTVHHDGHDDEPAGTTVVLLSPAVPDAPHGHQSPSSSAGDQ